MATATDPCQGHEFAILFPVIIAGSLACGTVPVLLQLGRRRASASR
ncbi:hypothetical protein SAMN05216483_2734 [Streptomyces sp. 2131.1]|nr:hypothetical protein SAMN05216483_2734 [Streptomyces sp. 2131.1]